MGGSSRQGKRYTRSHKVTSDKVELEGRLTLEKWTAWVAQYAVWSSKSYSEVPASEYFETISESEFVLDNFLSFQSEVKNILCTYLEYGEARFRDYTAVLDLQYRIESMDQSIFSSPKEESFHNWATSSLHDSSRIIQDCLSNRGEVYKKAFDGFADAQSLRVDYYSASVSYMTHFTAHALGLIHGCEVVQEVIREWIKLPEYHNLVEFVAVVENWQTFKDFSIDWTIQLAGASHG